MITFQLDDKTHFQRLCVQNCIMRNTTVVQRDNKQFPTCAIWTLWGSFAWHVKRGSRLAEGIAAHYRHDKSTKPFWAFSIFLSPGSSSLRPREQPLLLPHSSLLWEAPLSLWCSCTDLCQNAKRTHSGVWYRMWCMQAVLWAPQRRHNLHIWTVFEVKCSFFLWLLPLSLILFIACQ